MCQNLSWLSIKSIQKICEGTSLYCKRIEDKGHGIFTKTNIAKGSIVAYYPGVIYKEPYIGISNGIYKSALYCTSCGYPCCRNYSMDISELTNNIPPKDSIPYVGAFLNECIFPGDNNCELITKQWDGCGKHEKGYVDNFVYAISAIRNIKTDEELCWWYGISYDRNHYTHPSNPSDV